MPSLEFFVVAQSSSVDQRTNRLSVFDILDEFTPRRFPAYAPRVEALSVWVLDAADRGKDFQVMLKVSGEATADVDFAQNFTAQGPTLRTIQYLIGLPLLTSGIIYFEVFLNGIRSAGHQIRVLPADSNSQDDGTFVYPEDPPR